MEKKTEKRVVMPSWWTGERQPVHGYTDAVDTYCYCTVPAWYVHVPKYDYWGYFNVKDLQVIK